VGQEFLVRENTFRTALPTPDEGDLVAPMIVDVPVKAVGRNVELRVGEPLRIGVIPFQDCIPRPDPFELACHFAPECIRIGQKFFVGFLVVSHPCIFFILWVGCVIFHILDEFDIKILGHFPTYFTLLIVLNIVFKIW